MLCLLKAVILLMKDWIKVNSSYYFHTVDLELFLKTGSAYIIKDTFSSSLWMPMTVYWWFFTAILVTKQSRKQANPWSRSTVVETSTENTVRLVLNFGKLNWHILRWHGGCFEARNVVQNSVLPSSQLLRNIGSLITTSEVHVCHHHGMGFPKKLAS